jgi:hypothetical protein
LKAGGRAKIGALILQLPLRKNKLKKTSRKMIRRRKKNKQQQQKKKKKKSVLVLGWSKELDSDNHFVLELESRHDLEWSWRQKAGEMQIDRYSGTEKRDAKRYFPPSHKSLTAPISKLLHHVGSRIFYIISDVERSWDISNLKACQDDDIYKPSSDETA